MSGCASESCEHRLSRTNEITNDSPSKMHFKHGNSPANHHPTLSDRIYQKALPRNQLSLDLNSNNVPDDVDSLNSSPDAQNYDQIPSEYGNEDSSQREMRLRKNDEMERKLSLLEGLNKKLLIDSQQVFESESIKSRSSYGSKIENVSNENNPL